MDYESHVLSMSVTKTDDSAQFNLNDSFSSREACYPVTMVTELYLFTPSSVVKISEVSPSEHFSSFPKTCPLLTFLSYTAQVGNII